MGRLIQGKCDAPARRKPVSRVSRLALLLYVLACAACGDERAIKGVYFEGEDGKIRKKFACEVTSVVVREGKAACLSDSCPNLLSGKPTSSEAYYEKHDGRWKWTSLPSSHETCMEILDLGGMDAWLINLQKKTNAILEQNRKDMAATEQILVARKERSAPYDQCVMDLRGTYQREAAGQMSFEAYLQQKPVCDHLKPAASVDTCIGDRVKAFAEKKADPMSADQLAAIKSGCAESFR